jgi:hypothetical protein
LEKKLFFQEVMMDRSIYEARWVLGPIFGLCIGALAVSVFFG